MRPERIRSGTDLMQSCTGVLELGSCHSDDIALSAQTYLIFPQGHWTSSNVKYGSCTFAFRMGFSLQLRSTRKGGR